MKKKVKIILKDSNYHNGEPYVSVSYDTNIYGGSSPCDNKEEIQKAIESASNNIRSNGDYPIITDERQ